MQNNFQKDLQTISKLNNHRLNEFLENWKSLKGREDAENKALLDYLFQALGYKDARDAGGEFEVPSTINIQTIDKKTGYSKYTKKKIGRMDYLMPGRVLIEVKSRGKNLVYAREQLFNYWERITFNRPRYSILTNFDEFWIYDFDEQPDDPVHRFNSLDILKEYKSLGFLYPIPFTPSFNNHNVEVTKKSAKILGELFKSLIERGHAREKSQKFILQLVVALFADKIDLLPNQIFTRIIEEIHDDATAQKKLIFLLRLMATKEDLKKNAHKNIPYFNGGIFDLVVPIILIKKEIDLLYEASLEDWSKIRPSIFGSIFEASMNLDEQHRDGAHYTLETDILKIVRPSITNLFREKIAHAKTQKGFKKQLKQILIELENFKVLDPSCGSGNFLYVAYREMVRLEMEILKLLDNNFDSGQLRLSRISPKNFYGIDINSFGVELAKVSLSIGRKLSCDEFNLHGEILPFYNLDENIICADALFTKWPESHAIIGNPPFLGGSRIRLEKGDDYARKVFAKFKGKFKDIKGNVDFCVYWFLLAHESSASRIGLVGTNSIAQGFTRMAGLDYIQQNGGYIYNAISSEEWSGEANVHVAIVNWMRDNPTSYILDGKKVPFIYSNLTAEKTDFTQVKPISQNFLLTFKGCTLTGKGFLISNEEAYDWIKKDNNNKKVLRQIMRGKDLLNPSRELSWVIDFNDFDETQAELFTLPFFHLKKTVKIERQKNKDLKLKHRWWLFERRRPDMQKALSNLKFYFATTELSKFTIFRSIDINVLPHNTLIVVASDDFYILGILNSKIHHHWKVLQSSTFGKQPRYNNSKCFETFPFPQKLSESHKQKIRNAMTELENFRVAQAIQRQSNITSLYNDYFDNPSSKLYKLHQKLDKLVVEAYGWKYNQAKNYNEELFKLNMELTS